MLEEEVRPRRERWWRSAFFVIATIYVALLLARLLVDVLSGFGQIALTVFLAWLLAFVLAPVVRWLSRRTGMRRALSIGIVYGATLVVGAFFLFYAAASIAANVGEMAEDFPLTRARIEGNLHEWQDAVTFGRFQPNLVELYRDVEGGAISAWDSVVGEVPEVTVAVLGSLVLVIILSLYMLADSERILARLERVAPARWRNEAEMFERTVATAFGGFLRGQVMLAGVQTLLTVAVVVLADLPYGFLITVASALAMLVPFFGPPLALVPPIVATAIFASDWILVVAPVLLVVQTMLVNYLQPRLMREALGMHPILVLVGLLVGAQVAGLWGALFGIPIIAVINVFINYVVNLRTLEEAPAEQIQEVLEEVQQEAPEATREEVVALAADRVEGEAEPDADAVAPEALGAASGDLRAAAGELRSAAGEQREAAGEISDSAADLRDVADRLGDEGPGRPEGAAR